MTLLGCHCPRAPSADRAGTCVSNQCASAVIFTRILPAPHKGPHGFSLRTCVSASKASAQGSLRPPPLLTRSLLPSEQPASHRPPSRPAWTATELAPRGPGAVTSSRARAVCGPEPLSPVPLSPAGTQAAPGAQGDGSAPVTQWVVLPRLHLGLAPGPHLRASPSHQCWAPGCCLLGASSTKLL